MESSRNIEIKAEILSQSDFNNKIEIAKKLCESAGQTIEQRDIFFNATNGRLKLRYLKNKPSELIHYDRQDSEGPKLSTYDKIDLNEPELMEKILRKSIGIKGEVKKTRFLFLYEQTRIHLDKVEDLGYFLEFEVCLKPEESLEKGTIIAENLMKVFDIKKDNLITGAYMDKLLKK